MDDGRAASDAVMASSGAHRARVIRYSESRTPTAPARCPFFCLLFFGQAKKSKAQQTKNISRPIEGTSRSIEERFCVSTLDKDGTLARKYTTTLLNTQ